jgi:tetratricopeptide (TPR) repeat protein
LTSIAKALSRAVAIHKSGDLAEAERGYREILSKNPGVFDALHNLAMLEAQSGRLEGALGHLMQALSVNPHSIEALLSQANVFLALGRPEQALESCETSLKIKPEFAPAHYMHGNLLLELGRSEEALASYDRVVKLIPNNAEVLYNRGLALQLLKRYAEALVSYDRALALAPDDVEVLTNRGIVLYELRRYEEALASYDRALAKKPEFAEALNNRANVLLDLKRPDEALASCDRAVAIRPDYGSALNNRGIALQVLNRNDEALAQYEKAISLDANAVEAHWNGSLCKLLLGDYESGWREYEWRWRSDDFLAMSPMRHFSQPLWLGNEELADKTILLHAEQGFGDTLQFCRYIEWVAQKGAYVILEVEPALKTLLGSVRGVAQVAAKGESLPNFDFHCPLGSLPLAHGTRLENIPAEVPYLSPSRSNIEKWQEKLGKQTMPRIGLAWSGRITHTKQHERSIALEKLLPLADCGVTLISLQKDLQPHDQRLVGSQLPIQHFGNELADFSDTAALLSLMDVVISIDTSIAHLAGAMGKPAWIMLPFVADWRWLVDRDDSPWYPTARLVRQAVAGDWSSVVKKITGLLCDYANKQSN